MKLFAFLPNFGVPELIVLLLGVGVIAFVVVVWANRPKHRDRREEWEREDD